jgi:3-hydroxy-D-aspartate aldolase
MSPLPIPPQTPSLVIDHTVLMANLAAMQAACDAAGVRLRAHGKMHKCSVLGHLQVELGAVGLCCQTIGEAEAYAGAGIGDLLISAPLPHWAQARAAALAKTCKLAVVCDSATQIAALGKAAVAAGVEIGCLIDVNIGMHRAGCSVEEAPVLAALAIAQEGLRYDGIQAYFGHLQHLDDRAEANAAGTKRLADLVQQLGALGLAPPVVTGGGTGTYALDLAAAIFTELQCGSYALMDAEYGDCGGPDGDWPFKPALFIAATVISAKHKSHVTIDVGLKATSMDVPPRVVAGGPAGSLWRSLGDEHGAILHPAMLAHMKGGADPAIMDADPTIAWPIDAPQEGDTIWLQPGHCDPTINLYDAFFVAMGDGRLDRWPIDARRVSA